MEQCVGQSLKHPHWINGRGRGNDGTRPRAAAAASAVVAPEAVDSRPSVPPLWAPPPPLRKDEPCRPADPALSPEGAASLPCRPADPALLPEGAASCPCPR